ncbi:SH3-like domain-containing protein [Nereida sp. MMG025]|uniref:SH3-like domain-containing protein n=1 Tax=Nereida sp. MMG025 TaxID=2909981 RepID=UPI0021067EA1|nr:SH3-like domain-containing protein [Nereida sp. MMG025]
MIYVRVKTWAPPGHVRTPAYLRGKTGVIERSLGPFGNPEELAYGHDGTPTLLRRVRFTMSEVWGPDCEAASDTIEAEIYEHWLEPAPTPRTRHHAT